MFNKKEEKALQRYNYKLEGKNRASFRRKQRLDKWSTKRMNKEDMPFLQNGIWMQKCEYQPPCSVGTTYCEFPCNGDC